MRNLAAKAEGFTLIELMIVIAIIGILAAAAVPQYAQYTKKAKFSEVITKTAEYKSAVHLCVQDRNTLTDCTGSQNGVPPNITSAQNYISTLTVADGVITATATTVLDGLNYILTPTYNAPANALSWVVSGTCLATNMCRE